MTAGLKGQRGSVRARAASWAMLALFATAGNASAGDKDAAATTASASRIVSVGAAVTETVVALGAAQSLVGIDTTSEAPPTAPPPARVGYLRTLGAEGILSLAPDLVLASAEAGPPGVLDQLRASGVRCAVLADATGPEGAAALVVQVGEAIGRKDEAAALARRTTDEAARASLAIAGKAGEPSVLFVVHPPRSGAALVAGAGTPADAMIRLARGRNAAGELRGYAPLTPEAAATLSVDVVVVPEGTIARSGGATGLLEATGLARATSAASLRVVEVPASALSFGPDTGRRMLEFADRIRAGEQR